MTGSVTPPTADPARQLTARAPDAHSEIDASAFGHTAALLRFWIVAVGGLALDLWSKEWAFHTLRQDRTQVVIPDVLVFKTMFNPGALFGIGKGQTTLFLIASVLALVMVLWMFAQSGARRWLLHIALGGILAGALGNMYDRVFIRLVPWPGGPGGVMRMYEVAGADGAMTRLREYPGDDEQSVIAVPDAMLERYGGPPTGYVRDFIKIETAVFGRSVWPWVFNVADILLVGGVSILALHLMFSRRKGGEAAPVAGVA